MRGVPGEDANFEILPELDAAILSTLPKEGAKVGLKPLGKQVKAITRDLRENSLTSSQISGRIGTLRKMGWAVPVTVQPVGNGKGYQITPAGEEFVQSVNNGTYEEKG